MTAEFSVMGGQSVALLGYNVVAIKCTTEGGADVRLPTGFHPMCILPPLHGSCAVKTTTTTVDEQEVTTVDPTKVTIAGASVGDVFFIVGQN